MADILTPEMKNAIAALGALIKADPKCAAIENAIAEYEKSEELNALIAEYNTQQNLIADMYAKGEIAHLDARETAIRWNLAPWGFFWREDQAKNLEL